jgi:membrane protein DedA with SNARE-associated domain
MSELLDQLRLWIEWGIESLGYAGIALIMCLENVFPPIPSELVMPLAGFLVEKGRFSFVGVVLAGTLGSVAGALILYYFGLWADEPVVRSFIRRFGRFMLVSEKDLDRAMGFFQRYSQPVVFFGRLIPLIRSLISIPAGMNRMPLGRFLLFTTLGSTIWTSLLAAAGLILAENWELILDYIDRYQKLTLAVIALAVVGFVAVRIRSRMLKNRLNDDLEPEV